MSTAFDLETFNTKNDLHNFNTLSSKIRLKPSEHLVEADLLEPLDEWDDFISMHYRYEHGETENYEVEVHFTWLQYEEVWPQLNKECKKIFNECLCLRRKESESLRKERFNANPELYHTILKSESSPIRLCLRLLLLTTAIIRNTRRKADEIDEDFLGYAINLFMDSIKFKLTCESIWLPSEEILLERTFDYMITSLYNAICRQKSMSPKNVSVIGDILAKKVDFDAYGIDNEKLDALIETINY